MKYFIFCLAMHLLVMILFIVVTLVFSERNRKRKTKHGFMFFAPLFFAIITIAYALLFAAPMILDVKNVSGGKYQSYSGYVESVGDMKTCITIDGIEYKINPMAPMPDEGEYVKIKYTGYSRMIMEMEADQEPTFELFE